ncbi:hypothetical protein N7G274_006414 [Stereocaulon virgatum]|uniref:Uncharacterized protein n=1 Tax=Stereocaulon virgatum TaxID=373712 RepID=A0ABR4A7S4_9LECA
MVSESSRAFSTAARTSRLGVPFIDTIMQRQIRLFERMRSCVARSRPYRGIRWAVQKVQVASSGAQDTSISCTTKQRSTNTEALPVTDRKSHNSVLVPLQSAK